MLALVSFLIVILFSLIVVKVGSVALETTGLSRDIAAFQAQSAFSGVGFTTRESESLMTHPLRRKILRFLMLMGSAGLTSAIATLILTFMNVKGEHSLLGLTISNLAATIFAIVFVLFVVLLISRTHHFDLFVRWVLKKPLHLMKSRMALYDYERILGLSKGMSIVQFEVPKRHWMANKNIGKLKLEKEGVMVLGIFRTVHGYEEYIENPSDDFKISHLDKIVIYCKDTLAANLAKREKGAKGQAERQDAEKIHQSLDLLKQIHEDHVEEAIKK
ncbi:potassium transporter TrkA [Candidatus Woesearchaeota archaeon CG11_big_fil_rev_8_21_14_0_20_43_8]|nr:MAG: potassium transporter TrkA [Candidatus Woesearchaeota archaeon CG11_big_fil_rev_8_21_14_0_20_43_8]PIO07074.1 MAG: potassium transporter TrkA [Candidatus Woesearchaeota archaeon CG08_land_8_20_14_0_20_43_7]